jgi:hypothetical protein
MSPLPDHFIAPQVIVGCYYVYIRSIPCSIDGCQVKFPECDVFSPNSAPVDNLHHQVTAQVTTPTEWCITPKAREVGTVRNKESHNQLLCTVTIWAHPLGCAAPRHCGVLSKTTPEKRPEKASRFSVTKATNPKVLSTGVRRYNQPTEKDTESRVLIRVQVSPTAFSYRLEFEWQVQVPVSQILAHLS